RRDAHTIAGLADAALEHEAHAEIPSDLLHFDRLALVDEGGVARDDEQARHLREVGDQVFGHAVAEIFLLGIAADVGEGQHGDRRLVRHGRPRCLFRRDSRMIRSGDAKTRTGLAMFLSGFSPKSSSATSVWSLTKSRTAREM